MGERGGWVEEREGGGGKGLVMKKVVGWGGEVVRD